jgi:hypothetical protein
MILRRPLAIIAAASAARRTAAMEPCRDSSTTEGIQTHPIALAMVNRLRETEGAILGGNQSNRLIAAPDRTATETYVAALKKAAFEERGWGAGHSQSHSSTSNVPSAPATRTAATYLAPLLRAM